MGSGGVVGSLWVVRNYIDSILTLVVTYVWNAGGRGGWITLQIGNTSRRSKRLLLPYYPSLTLEFPLPRDTGHST